MTAQLPWERWTEIDDLFARALEQPPAKRLEFITAECKGDVAVLHAVTDLVEASDRAEESLRGPSNSLLRLAFDAPTAGHDRTPGEQIGRYRLIRELGRGGMATVFEAERADGTYSQRVAVKLLRHGLHNTEGSRRFQVETTALAALSHPNIARLLDVGATEQGYPYIVMELVEGEPLTGWADRLRLPIDARLALFLQVTDAVAFAHRHLVVHRDLKPSNVLVGDDGRVRLLDFGIAKLLEPDGSNGSDTKPATRWMTPEYASPEQVHGQPVTTATDVHGLGVLLYELLTGIRPFTGTSPFELEKAVSEAIPERPSAAAPTYVAEARSTRPDRLRRLLSGDLDAIVSKALRKEPGERYPSALALARDVERHRAGLPIEAQAGLRAYRIRKFVRRHWFGVGTAAALSTLLLGSSVVLWRMQIAAVGARDDARREAENARLVTGFLADVFRGRNPDRAPPDTITARELLAWGRVKADSEFKAHPALQSQLYGVLSAAYTNLGLLDDATTMRMNAVERARTAHGERSEQVALQLLWLSEAHRSSRDGANAVGPAREALEILTERHGSADSLVTEALLELGKAWRLLDQPDSAASLFQRVIETERAKGRAASPQYLDALLSLAPVRRAQGDLEAAGELYEELIPRYRELNGTNMTLATHLNNLAFLQRTKGENARAESNYRDALAIVTERYGRGHPNTEVIASNLAGALELQGKMEEALAVRRETLEGVTQQWPGGHWRVGSAHSDLGKAFLRTRHFDSAFVHLGSAREMYVATIGARHLWTWFVEALAAAGHVAEERSDIGQPYLDRFYQARVETLPHADSLEARQGLDLQLTPFLTTLNALGLETEFVRFRELLSQRAREQFDQQLAAQRGLSPSSAR